MPSDRWSEIQHCDVCWLVDGDIQPKETNWCPSCKANICRECWNNWPRRVEAMIRRGLGKRFNLKKGEK